MPSSPRLLVLGLLATIATPLAAQSFSDSYTFLKAVREGDANKVMAIANNPGSSAINAVDSRGEGALHILVGSRNLEWLAFMLARGARPDVQAHDGSTPLGRAAQLGWVEGATQLLARGAQVDLVNARGETPLILAVQARQLSMQDRLSMVRLLMSQGADPARQDSLAGYSALDYARQDSRGGEIVRALETSRPRASRAVVGPTQ